MPVCTGRREKKTPLVGTSGLRPLVVSGALFATLGKRQGSWFPFTQAWLLATTATANCACYQTWPADADRRHRTFKGGTDTGLGHACVPNHDPVTPSSS